LVQSNFEIRTNIGFYAAHDHKFALKLFGTECGHKLEINVFA